MCPINTLSEPIRIFLWLFLFLLLLELLDLPGWLGRKLRGEPSKMEMTRQIQELEQRLEKLEHEQQVAKDDPTQ